MRNNRTSETLTTATADRPGPFWGFTLPNGPRLVEAASDTDGGDE